MIDTTDHRNSLLRSNIGSQFNDIYTNNNCIKTSRPCVFMRPEKLKPFPITWTNFHVFVRLRAARDFVVLLCFTFLYWCFFLFFFICLGFFYCFLLFFSVSIYLNIPSNFRYSEFIFSICSVNLRHQCYRIHALKYLV